MDHLPPADQIKRLKALNLQLLQERNDEVISNDIKNMRLRNIEAVLVDHHRLGQFTTFGRSSGKDDATQPLESHVVSELMEYLRSQSLRMTRSILYRYRGITIFSGEECALKLREFSPEIEDSHIKSALEGADADSNKENLLAAIIMLLIKRLVFEDRQPTCVLPRILLDEYQHCLFQRGS